MNIDYSIKLRDEQEFHYSLVISSDTCLLENNNPQTPDWTKLSENQCENCSLEPTQHEYCPVALNMVPIIDDVKDLISYTDVTLTVKTLQRTTIVNTTAQKALTSLMGLVMAVSACPHMEYFRPLAHFHLPVASQEETFFRSLSVILINEYLANNDDLNSPSIEYHLSEIYKNLQIVNEAFVHRIRQIIHKDAPANAVVSLHMLSHYIPMGFQDSINNIRRLFTPELPSDNSK